MKLRYDWRYGWLNEGRMWPIADRLAAIRRVKAKRAARVAAQERL